MSPYLANFVLLVETGFLHVGQGSFELLISGDPPSSASVSAGITGVSHRARLLLSFERSLLPDLLASPYLSNNKTYILKWDSALVLPYSARESLLLGLKPLFLGDSNPVFTPALFSSGSSVFFVCYF